EISTFLKCRKSPASPAAGSSLQRTSGTLGPRTVPPLGVPSAGSTATGAAAPPQPTPPTRQARNQLVRIAPGRAHRAPGAALRPPPTCHANPVTCRGELSTKVQPLVSGWSTGRRARTAPAPALATHHTASVRDVRPARAVHLLRLRLVVDHRRRRLAALQHEDLHRRRRDPGVRRDPPQDRQHVALNVIHLRHRRPRLDDLADPALLLLVIPDLHHPEELIRAAIEVLLVARLGKRKPLAELAIDLRGEEQGRALVEFHGVHPSAADRLVRGQG